MPSINRTTSSRVLLETARSNSGDTALLERIAGLLSQRSNDNDVAFQAYLEVGKILQAAKDNVCRRHVEDRRREQERLRRQEANGFFEWPKTDAPFSRNSLDTDVFYYKQGLLSYVGYKVGHDGEEPALRRRLLDCVFHNRLPRVDSEHYMAGWCEPETPCRLKKMADCIAAFTRDAKRRGDADMSRAISD